MKKYLSGIAAIVLAVAASAFTAPSTSKLDPVYDWKVYDANGHATTMFLDNKTVAEVQSANPQCNGASLICFQRYDAARTAPDGFLIQKP